MSPEPLKKGRVNWLSDIEGGFFLNVWRWKLILLSRFSIKWMTCNLLWWIKFWMSDFIKRDRNILSWKLVNFIKSFFWPLLSFIKSFWTQMYIYFMLLIFPSKFPGTKTVQKNKIKGSPLASLTHYIFMDWNFTLATRISWPLLWGRNGMSAKSAGRLRACPQNKRRFLRRIQPRSHKFTRPREWLLFPIPTPRDLGDSKHAKSSWE